MSSRLIVKNIPKKISDNRLRDIFSKHGEVTQIKVLENRRFAYVGYHSEKHAAAARRYLHDTYIDTSKIEGRLSQFRLCSYQLNIGLPNYCRNLKVLDALAYGDSKLPRPWSKYSSGSSAHNKGTVDPSIAAVGGTELRKREKQLETDAKRAGESAAEERVRREKELLGKLYALKQGVTDDAELEEFWDVMGAQKRTQRTWANDAAQGKASGGAAGAAAATAQFSKVEGKMYGARGVPMVRSHVKFDDSDDEYQELATDAAEPEAKQTETEPKGSSAAMEVDAEDSVARDDNVSDMDYLRSKMRGAADAEGSTANATDDSDSDDDDDKAKTVAPVVETKQVRKKSGKKGKPTDADAAKAAAVSDKPTVRLRGLPFKATDDDVIDFFHPLTTLMVRLTKNRENRPSGRGFVDFALKDIPRALKYNGNMMNDRYIEVSRDVDDPRANETKPSKIPQKPVHKFADKHVDPTLLGESGRIFVRNLAYSCTEDELEALMTPFGPVSEVLIPLDRSTKKSKAIGFVTFLMPEHAIAAYQALDGQPFQGRLLHLIPSEEKRDHSGVAEGDDENETFKKKAARKRKAESGAAFNWNTLFLRTDAVAGAMATDYGVTKADILDPEADGSMAVRMALGETHVVAENKRFLRENGVVLDAFDTRVDSRSKTTILVKNTPYETTIDEIRALFAKHGDVGRVIFPPSHTMAVVEMLLPQEARQAFKGLAYRKFKHVPIYLEWAPEGCLSASKSGDGDADGEADVGEADKETGARGDDAEPTSGSTLFVKNLSFDTTEDGLRIHFERVVAIRSVRIATKKNPKSGPPLSMGFAFVEFATTADAMMAVKSLQNSDLDGHKLELKVSTKKDDSGRGRERGQAVKVGGTKLLIRNLPFEANKKELKELCQPFGSIKSIRIPKKFDGEHRGFAFVDFLTKKEAKSAFEALSLSTHLYGRRLVVEWAADDTSLETLQSKTRAAYSTSGSDQKRAKIDETL